MNKEGVACSLLTGQRVVTDPTARHLACTVEMADVARHVAPQLASSPHAPQLTT
jgi:hypothetical protein